MIEYLTNLISAYKYTVTPYSRGIFLPKLERIRIDVFTNETFAQIFDLLKCELGEPLYTHSFFGHLWKKDGKIIAFSQIEEQLHYDTLNIFVLNKIPSGRKMPYEEYAQLENAVKAFADKYSLQCNDGMHYNHLDYSLYYWIQSDTKALYLNIKGNKMIYYLSILKREDIGTRMTPKGNGKKLINRKKFESINNALTEIFDELENIA